MSKAVIKQTVAQRPTGLYLTEALAFKTSKMLSSKISKVQHTPEPFWTRGIQRGYKTL
jgi:hypothetical protein